MLRIDLAFEARQSNTDILTTHNSRDDDWDCVNEMIGAVKVKWVDLLDCLKKKSNKNIHLNVKVRRKQCPK